MSKQRTGRRSRWLSLGGLLLILGALAVILRTPPADGYEISIYQVYPTYFWVLLVGAVLVGQTVILRSAQSRVRDPYWRIGFGVILFVDVILLLIPHFRGYAIYGHSDPLTHVGFVRDIARTGVVSTSDIYPSLHLLLLSISYATGLDVMSSVGVVPPVISLLGVVSSYLLLRRAFDDRRTVLFGLVFVAFLTYQTAHIMGNPYAQSTLLVPFILYLAVKERQTRTLRTKIPLVVMLIATVTYHPLTSLFLLVIFLVSLVLKRIASSDGFRTGTGIPDFVSTNATTIVVVMFIAWYHRFAGIIFSVRSVFNFLVSVGGQSELQTYTSTIQETSPRLIDLIEIAVFTYGHEMLVIGLAAQYGLVVCYLLWRRRAAYDHYKMVFIVSCGIFVVLSMITFVNDFIFGHGRPLQFAKIFATFLLGPLFILLFDRVDSGTLRTGLHVGLYGTLALVVTLSMLSVYFAPLDTQKNRQVSQMEVEGADWTLENRNDAMLIEEFRFRQDRFYDAFYGVEATHPTIRDEGMNPPAHFNYTEYDRVGQSYENDTYLVITEKGRVAYPGKFPDYRRFWQFTPEDFARVDQDITAEQVYTNGEFEVYLINGTRTESNLSTTADTTTRHADPSVVVPS